MTIKSSDTKSLISHPSTATPEKMRNHLWYQTEKFAFVSLFDSCVKNETKKKKLKNREGINKKARILLGLED